MGWLDEFKAKVSDFSFGVAGRKPARTPKTPRDLLLKSIEESIAFHDDPRYRVASGRKKGSAPDLVYETVGTNATITLRYYRAKLKLNGNDDQLYVDAKHLKDALSALRNGVANGEFDGQLDKIRADRVNASKVSKTKKSK